MGSRTRPERAQSVRASWWRAIRDLGSAEAKAALLQVLIDIDDHWDKEHPEDGLPEDLGIAPDEYLIELMKRIRSEPPSETRQQ